MDPGPKTTSQIDSWLLSLYQPEELIAKGDWSAFGACWLRVGAESRDWAGSTVFSRAVLRLNDRCRFELSKIRSAFLGYAKYNP